MVTKLNQLRQFARLAELKADLDLRSLAELTAQLMAAQERLSDTREKIAACFQDAGSLDLPSARIANSLVHDLSQDLLSEAREIDRIRSSHEVARQRAAKAVGRAEVIRQLSAQSSRRTASQADAF
jgi:uncharacterized coiled-coil DUF342 family protein